MSAPAYTLDKIGPNGTDSLTFCAECAFVPTAIAIIIALDQVPANMDEAIAMIALSQIENGVEVSAPVAFNGPGTCDNCDRAFGHQPSDAA